MFQLNLVYGNMKLRMNFRDPPNRVVKKVHPMKFTHFQKTDPVLSQFENKNVEAPYVTQK